MTTATSTKIVDLRGLWVQARQGQRFSGRRSADWFRKPYAPAGSARLHLAQATQESYAQNSYSDDIVYAIPYSGTITPESTARLNAFFWAASNHDGFAGGGCTWSLSGIDPERHVVLAHCRSSISD